MLLCLPDEVAVAKDKSDDKSHDTPTETVRLPRHLIEMARQVCAHRSVGGKKLKMTAYLVSLISDQLAKDHAEYLQEIADAVSQKKPKK